MNITVKATEPESVNRSLERGETVWAEFSPHCIKSIYMRAGIDSYDGMYRLGEKGLVHVGGGNLKLFDIRPIKAIQIEI